jgi:hypothetical protein
LPHELKVAKGERDELKLKLAHLDQLEVELQITEEERDKALLELGTVQDELSCVTSERMWTQPTATCRPPRSAEAPGAMLGTPYQTKLTLLANLLTFLRILLQRKLDHDTLVYGDLQNPRHPNCHICI